MYGSTKVGVIGKSVVAKGTLPSHKSYDGNDDVENQGESIGTKESQFSASNIFSHKAILSEAS